MFTWKDRVKDGQGHILVHATFTFRKVKKYGTCTFTVSLFVQTNVYSERGCIHVLVHLTRKFRLFQFKFTCPAIWCSVPALKHWISPFACWHSLKFKSFVSRGLKSPAGCGIIDRRPLSKVGKCRFWISVRVQLHKSLLKSYLVSVLLLSSLHRSCYHKRETRRPKMWVGWAALADLKKHGKTSNLWCLRLLQRVLGCIQNISTHPSDSWMNTVPEVTSQTWDIHPLSVRSRSRNRWMELGSADTLCSRVLECRSRIRHILHPLARHWILRIS